MQAQDLARRAEMQWYSCMISTGGDTLWVQKESRHALPPPWPGKVLQKRVLEEQDCMYLENAQLSVLALPYCIKHEH